MTSPQDMVLVAELPPLLSTHIRVLLQLNAADGSVKRYECYVFQDYESGWGSATMVEKMTSCSPASVRYKLRPVYHGPCILALNDSPSECRVSYFALYPVIGPPVVAIPESIDLALTPHQICSAALEHLYSMAVLDPDSASPTVLYTLQEPVDSWIFDIRNKRLWQVDFSHCILVHQSWTGTSYLSPSSSLLNGEDATELDLSHSRVSPVSQLLSAVRELVAFPHNSFKSDDNYHHDWIALDEFLANKRQTQSIRSCIQFFSQFAQVSDQIMTSPFGADSSTSSSAASTPGLRGTAASASIAIGASTTSSTSPSSLLLPPGLATSPSISVGVPAPETAPGAAKSYQAPKYPRAPGSNAPLSGVVVAVAQQAAQALSDHKAGVKCNPIVIVNDLHQRLYGAPPTLKDLGRLGGPDHIPRFGCSFTFPSGETIVAEGSSKQDAKLNVATRLLEIIAHAAR